MEEEKLSDAPVIPSAVHFRTIIDRLIKAETEDEQTESLQQVKNALFKVDSFAEEIKLLNVLSEKWNQLIDIDEEKELKQLQKRLKYSKNPMEIKQINVKINKIRKSMKIKK